MFRILWLDAPERFARDSQAERNDHMRATLGAASGEAYIASTFPLKPDGVLTVLHIHAGITEDGFVRFAPEVVNGFAALGQLVLAQLTPQERDALDRSIAAAREIGSAHGASDEELAVVVPTRLVAATKSLIDEIFSAVDEPLVGA